MKFLYLYTNKGRNEEKVMKVFQFKKRKQPEEKKQMKDYLIVADERLSFEERLKQRVYSKQGRNLILLGSIILLALSIILAMVLLFPSPWKGKFSYMEPFGIYNDDIEDIYVGKLDDTFQKNGFQIDDFEHETIQINIGALGKIIKKQEKQLSEENFLEIHLHVPWNGEKNIKTGIYEPSEMISNETAKLQVKKEIKSIYSKKLLSKILQYTNITIQGSIPKRGIQIDSESNLSQIEVKEKEIVLTYNVGIYRTLLNTSSAISKREEIILNFTEWGQSSRFLGTYQFPVTWQTQETVTDINELGKTMVFDDVLIFYQMTENENPLHKTSQIEIYSVETKANKNDIYLWNYKHIYTLNQNRYQPVYLEKNNNPLKTEVNITDYSWQNIKAYYEVKEKQPDYFVIPYVFEGKKRKQVVTLPVPKEDGTFDGNYSFSIKGDGEHTEVKIKKAYWNKKELEELGVDSLCYELEITDTGSKKELDSIDFELLDRKDMGSLYQYGGDSFSLSGLDHKIVWQGETPYLLISPLSLEDLEGRTEWQISITNTWYRYKQPLKIPLKNN